MAPNTAGDPWELDPIIHRDDEDNLVLPEPLQPFSTPTGETFENPSQLELTEPPADPGFPGAISPF